MLRFIIACALLCLTQKAVSRQLRVAIIDTGTVPRASVCAPSLDLTGKGHMDVHGHSTNVTYLIQQEAGLLAGTSKKPDVCFIFIKFYHNSKNYTNNFDKAFEYAIAHKADIVNISAGGFGINRSELKQISIALEKNIVLVASSGNEGKDLTNKCDYYPACADKRVIVVGNGKSADKRHVTSNYGSPVDVWIDGENVGPVGLKMTGTSQSAAMFTGRLIKEVHKRLFARTPNNVDEARDYLSKAIIKKYDLERKLMEQVKKNVPPSIKKATETVAPIAPIVHIIQTQSFSIEFSF